MAAEERTNKWREELHSEYEALRQKDCGDAQARSAIELLQREQHWERLALERIDDELTKTQRHREELVAVAEQELKREAARAMEAALAAQAQQHAEISCTVAGS